jgi:hypothetical protein
MAEENLKDNQEFLGKEYDMGTCSTSYEEL